MSKHDGFALPLSIENPFLKSALLSVFFVASFDLPLVSCAGICHRNELVLLA